MKKIILILLMFIIFGCIGEQLESEQDENMVCIKSDEIKGGSVKIYYYYNRLTETIFVVFYNGGDLYKGAAVSVIEINISRTKDILKKMNLFFKCCKEEKK